MRKGNEGALVTGILYLVALATVYGSARADTRTFPKIADQSTAVPGGTGTFTAFTQPQVSQGNIVFAATGPGSQLGIYRYDKATQSRSVIVDMNDD